MKFAQLNNDLLTVLDKLSAQDLPFKASYRINRLITHLQKEGRAFEVERIKMLKRFAKVDDKGELIKDENGNAQFEDGKQKEFAKAFTEASLTDIDGLITIESTLLEKATLTAQEIAILGDIITE